MLHFWCQFLPKIKTHDKCTLKYNLNPKGKKPLETKNSLHYTVQTHSNMEHKYNIENMPQQVDQPYMGTLPISKLYLALKVHLFWTIRFFSFLQLP